jgi:hypothetical protein
MLRLLEELALVDGVESGFVHVDSIADPYGKVVANQVGLSADDFSAEGHGSYWAVLLTEGHIDKLGGIAAVRQKAPCAVVNEVESPRGRSLLCALTE